MLLDKRPNVKCTNVSAILKSERERERPEVLTLHPADILRMRIVHVGVKTESSFSVCQPLPTII